MSEQFSILLGNHSRLEAGQTDGAWLPMPATTEQLHDAMLMYGWNEKKLSLKPTTKPCTRRSPRRIKVASRKKPKRKAAK